MNYWWNNLQYFLSLCKWDTEICTIVSHKHILLVSINKNGARCAHELKMLEIGFSRFTRNLLQRTYRLVAPDGRHALCHLREGPFWQEGAFDRGRFIHGAIDRGGKKQGASDRGQLTGAIDRTPTNLETTTFWKVIISTGSGPFRATPLCCQNRTENPPDFQISPHLPRRNISHFCSGLRGIHIRKSCISVSLVKDGLHSPTIIKK